MILQALKIDDNGTEVVITDISLAWTSELLNEKEPIIVAPTVQTGYEDISTIENWAKWGNRCIGKAQGFMDWKCLRSEIKTLVNAKTSNDIGSNWNSLNSEEQKIACRYLTNLVPSAKFIETFTNSVERTQISLNFDVNSQEARKQRIEFMRLALMGAVGSVNALKFYDDCVKEGRVESYVGGIESKASDGVDGITDMILGTESTQYDTNATGIKAALINRGYVITDGSGDTLEDKCNMLIGIANGLY